MRDTNNAKRETLNIQIKPEIRDLIDRAAKLHGKSLTDFVLDSARLAAENTLLDQLNLTLSPPACEQFQARLDRSPQANDRLRKTITTAAPWEGE